LAQTDNEANATEFIAFMLDFILQTMEKNAPVNLEAMKTTEAILALVSQNVHITRKEMAKQIGKDIRTIGRGIKQLQGRGLIKRVESK